MRTRVTFWWKMLRRGLSVLNGAAGVVGAVVLLLGIVGIVVPLVFHWSPLVIAVALVSLLVVVVAEGSYRVWRETDKEKKTAVDSLEAADKQLGDQRAAQAKLVEVTRDDRTPPPSMADSLAGQKRPPGVTISVANKSEKVIRDLILYWREGTSPWGAPDRVPYLPAHQTEKRWRGFPDNSSSGNDISLCSADVYFQDANQVQWCAMPDGKVTESAPPQT